MLGVKSGTIKLKCNKVHLNYNIPIIYYESEYFQEAWCIFFADLALKFNAQKYPQHKWFVQNKNVDMKVPLILQIVNLDVKLYLSLKHEM